MIEQALQAVDRGESVIAVNGGKKPWYSWKPYQQTPATKEQVQAWSENRSCAGFAVVCGAVSRLVVLDFDDEDGRALCERLGLAPHVRTPSGGFHVRFAHPGFKVKTLNSEAAKALQERWHGLDIRADGGYAVEWGRNRDGDYRTLRDLTELEDLERLPHELLVDLGIAANGTAQPKKDKQDRGRKVRHPGRHAHLLGIAGAMRGRGDPADVILAELRRVNARDCDPPKPDADLVALADDIAGRYEPTPGKRYAVGYDDKGKLRLPEKPAADDIDGMCGWLTGVFSLDPAHPIVGGERQGLHGPDAHVVLRRRGALPLRFEPVTRIANPTRLREVLEGCMLHTDGEPPGFKNEHTYAIAHVVRMLCGHSERLSAEAETVGLVGDFLSDAKPVEGFTTYGTSGRRYEAALQLQRPAGLDEAPRYLVDSDTGEFVVRVGDLAAMVRRRYGGLKRGWLDGCMAAIGWRRVEVQGYGLPGRGGRRQGPHLRANVYRGFLPDNQESVNT
jgi:Bifunctional DNA primase/polymerase, N-terminal